MHHSMALFESLLLATLLALGAGFVDAYGYITLGHVFVADMTGTTVLALGEPSHVTALILLAAVMGLQSSAVTRFRSISLQTIVITGTIVRLAEGAIAMVLSGGRVEPDVHEANVHHVLTWSGYLAGAGASGLALERLRAPLVPPAGALLAAAPLPALIETREPDR